MNIFSDNDRIDVFLLRKLLCHAVFGSKYNQSAASFKGILCDFAYRRRNENALQHTAACKCPAFDAHHPLGQHDMLQTAAVGKRRLADNTHTFGYFDFGKLCASAEAAFADISQFFRQRNAFERFAIGKCGFADLPYTDGILHKRRDRMLTRKEAIAACMTLPDAYEDYPFDDTWTVMRHQTNKKMFAAIYEREGRIWINVKALLYHKKQ